MTKLLRDIVRLETQHSPVTYGHLNVPAPRRELPMFLHNLRLKGLIEFDSQFTPRDQAPITLTEAGRELAAQPYLVEVTLHTPEDGEVQVLFHLNTGEIQPERAADLTWTKVLLKAKDMDIVKFRWQDFQRAVHFREGAAPTPRHFARAKKTPRLGHRHPSLQESRRLSYQAAVAWPGKHLVVRGPYDAQWTELAQHIPGHRWSEHDQADLFPVTSDQTLLQVLTGSIHHHLLSPEDRREIEELNEIYARRTT
ncbi:hypothetical protein [Deinococcus aluminii]|uniref:Uncharacterized protein n=1 Tax=Deinococcus aluminii TaxID=1656885 RepID=A0ABP9XFJ5_9DEIO